MKPPASLFDMQLAASDGESAAAVQAELAARGVKRVVLAGRGEADVYADLLKELTSAKYELLLIAEATPQGAAVRRAILDARAAGATLTDVGQCTALLGSHRLCTALIFVGDPGPAEGLANFVRAK